MKKTIPSTKDKLYKRDGKKCCYCEIKEEDFIRIWGLFYGGRSRGYKLELNRKDSKKGYTEENCHLACPVCTNAKSDKFSYEEFKEVGKIIKEIWISRKTATKKKKYIEQKKKKELRPKLYIRDGKKCHYCEIDEEDFVQIWGKFYNKRSKLEVDRKDNKKGYSEGNCVLSCPLCNCAKTDKFVYREFKKMGNAIKKIWILRKERISLNSKK